MVPRRAQPHIPRSVPRYRHASRTSAQPNRHEVGGRPQANGGRGTTPANFALARFPCITGELEPDQTGTRRARKTKGRMPPPPCTCGRHKRWAVRMEIARSQADVVFCCARRGTIRIPVNPPHKGGHSRFLAFQKRCSALQKEVLGRQIKIQTSAFAFGWFVDC